MSGQRINVCRYYEIAFVQNRSYYGERKDHSDKGNSNENDTLNKKLVSEEEKSAFFASYDWKRMTKQDENVWQEIFYFLDN